MTSRYLIILLCLTVFSCNNSEKKEEAEAKDQELVMAERSEMALLMNDMYAFNQSIRQQVIEGTLSNSYPENFERIHTAVLTDPSDRNETFESFSKLFIESQKSVFEAPRGELVVRYNNSVNACIACHNKMCTGPIPRIKKLLIEE